MKTYNQILTEFSSYSSNKRLHYLKTLTVEELKLFKNKASLTTYSLICVLIDHILIEKIQEDRENKLNQIL
jgi:hypothetical protein